MLKEENRGTAADTQSPVRSHSPGDTESGRMSAGDISAHFPVTDAAISRHLSLLKEADLIRDTREGKFIFYDINTSVLEEVMLLLTALKGEREV